MKSRFTNLYFVRLYRKNKVLFVLILLFFLLQINANFIFRGQQTPFFQWTLYSQSVPPQQTYSFYEVVINKDKVLKFPHTWQEPGKQFFVNTLQHYVFMLEHGGKAPLKDYIDLWNTNHPQFSRWLPGVKMYADTTEMKEFPAWYRRKIVQFTGIPVRQVDVYKVEVKYEASGKVQKQSSEFVCSL